MIFTFILKNLPNILQISQIALLVPKMNSPWLEYEKWYITSWYTVKPDFCRIFPEKPDSGSGKPDTQSRNLFVLKYTWLKVSITWKFQPNWANN